MVKVSYYMLLKHILLSFNIVFFESYDKNPFNHMLVFPNIWKPCLITYAPMVHFLSLRKARHVLRQLYQIPAY